MSKYTYFISDLHLQASAAQITHLFDQFLHEHASNADAIYILGDLFEAWLGDDDLDDFNHSIIKKIRHCVDNGTPVFFMPGNRDFLIGQRFAQLTGCTLLADPTVITLYHNNILLMHGDTLCTNDKLHQLYRCVVQNSVVKRLCLLLMPLSIRRRVAKYLRKMSKKHISKQSAPNMDVINQSVIAQFQQHPASMLIHGHTHRPMIETLFDNHQALTRYVLSAWHDYGSALRISANHAPEYLIIQSKSSR